MRKGVVSSMDRLATDADLEELTGYQMPGKQLECLRRHGLRPIIRPDGRPRVTFAALTAAMLGAMPSANEVPVAGPDFSGFRKAG